jgi:hypothetical protein
MSNGIWSFVWSCFVIAVIQHFCYAIRPVERGRDQFQHLGSRRLQIQLTDSNYSGPRSTSQLGGNDDASKNLLQ